MLRRRLNNGRGTAFFHSSVTLQRAPTRKILMNGPPGVMQGSRTGWGKTSGRGSFKGTATPMWGNAAFPGMRGIRSDQRPGE